MSPKTVQIQAEEEALRVLGLAREMYDLAQARLHNAQDFFANAKEQYAAAKGHFHAISLRSVPASALPAVPPPSVLNASTPSGPDSSTRPVPPSCFHPEVIDGACTVCGDSAAPDDMFAVWGPV